MLKSLQSILILHFTPSLHFTLSLQSAFYTQSAFYPWSAVCSLQSAVRSLRFTLTDFQKGESRSGSDKKRRNRFSRFIKIPLG